MTGEEMERAIEFLLKSQATLEAQIAETNKIVQLHAETQTEFIQAVTRSLEGQAAINDSLRAADARTDERLNKLIGLFEQHIIAGH